MNYLNGELKRLEFTNICKYLQITISNRIRFVTNSMQLNSIDKNLGVSKIYLVLF